MENDKKQLKKQGYDYEQTPPASCLPRFMIQPKKHPFYTPKN